MKKDLRWIILATLGALALLLGAPLYQRYKVAGEEIVGVEIYYVFKDPKSGGSGYGGEILKYTASGEKAKRVLQQLQLVPLPPRLGIHNDWIHSFHEIVTVRRNGRKSADWINLKSSFAWTWNHNDNRQNQFESRLTPESSRYFRALLSPQNSISIRPRIKNK